MLNSFYLESYGVPVRIESADTELLNDARELADLALVGNLRITEPVETPHVFRLAVEDEHFVLYKNDERFRFGTLKEPFLHYFDSSLRLTVAEFAVGRVFVHAGVVGWKGKAIVLPARSYSGKTSVVAEFVRQGAEYYSDEYAVLDEEGFVHPFARRLSMRIGAPRSPETETVHLTAAELGGVSGKAKMPIGWLLFTAFDENGVWEPETLSPGQGTLEMLSQTIPIRYAPEFSLGVLKKATASAIILKSHRPDAVKFVNFFLDFVDNKAF